jgi:murein DD-endopeptidase MepM/ murein hydrolase activator NlpD
LLDGHIVMQSTAIYRLPFDDDGGWNLGVGNWDEPGGGHGVGQPFGMGQEYAFDFGHVIGGNVRAARSGRVVFVENNAGNTVDTNAPNYDPNAPGYGTAILIRHRDGTAAAYDHLRFQSPRVVMDQTVQRGEIIALSGHTGRSFNPHLHFDVRQYWNSASDLGLTIPIYFEDKHHPSWRPQAGDALASNNS